MANCCQDRKDIKSTGKGSSCETRTKPRGTSCLIYKNIILFFSDGTALIGCSELTGRYWNGGASVCAKWTNRESGGLPNRDINLISGSADGCFIGTSNKVIRSPFQIMSKK